MLMVNILDVICFLTSFENFKHDFLFFCMSCITQIIVSSYGILQSPNFIHSYIVFGWVEVLGNQEKPMKMEGITMFGKNRK